MLLRLLSNEILFTPVAYNTHPKRVNTMFYVIVGIVSGTKQKVLSVYSYQSFIIQNHTANEYCRFELFISGVVFL